jgi:hypothetical protein
MKKRFAALLLLGWLISAGVAWAQSPVTVGHSMTNYALSADSVVLNYTLIVRNPGTGALSNVTVSLIPLTIITTDKISLNVGNLDPLCPAFPSNMICS